MHKDGACDVSISSKHFGELHDDFASDRRRQDAYRMEQFDNILARLVFHFYI